MKRGPSKMARHEMVPVYRVVKGGGAMILAFAVLCLILQSGQSYILHPLIALLLAVSGLFFFIIGCVAQNEGNK